MFKELRREEIYRFNIANRRNDTNLGAISFSLKAAELWGHWQAAERINI